jgi:hypothetical protein
VTRGVQLRQIEARLHRRNIPILWGVDETAII